MALQLKPRQLVIKVPVTTLKIQQHVLFSDTLSPHGNCRKNVYCSQFSSEEGKVPKSKLNFSWNIFYVLPVNQHLSSSTYFLSVTGEREKSSQTQGDTERKTSEIQTTVYGHNFSFTPPDPPTYWFTGCLLIFSEKRTAGRHPFIVTSSFYILFPFLWFSLSHSY